ncbi:MAG: helix-turn-helix domain-containing protein [Alphaproteobacteria bacterium]
MLRVVIPLLHGGYACTAVTPIEVFKSAGVIWNLLHGEKPEPCFEVVTVTADGKPVHADTNLSLTPQTSAAEVSTPDLIFIPAGGLTLDVVTRNGYDIDAVAKPNAAIIPHIARWASEGAQVAGACAGVSLVAMAGLLDGRIATAHWGLAHLYKARFPKVDWRPELLLTDAGGIYCGGGVNAASDLALYLVEKFFGRDVAAKTARALLIEMPRPWQAAFSDLAPNIQEGDPSIGRALAWLHQNFARDVQNDALAEMVGMSPRTFSRRFKGATGQTPLTYLHSVRISAAKRLLENERRTVQDVMKQVGYEDAIFFRNLFKRHTGEAPAAYRERFAGMRINTRRENAA